jgi:hypothetical protein
MCNGMFNTILGADRVVPVVVLAYYSREYQSREYQIATSDGPLSTFFFANLVNAAQDARCVHVWLSG